MHPRSVALPSCPSDGADAPRISKEQINGRHRWFVVTSRCTIAMLAGGVLLLAGCTAASGTASSEYAAPATVSAAGEAPAGRDGERKSESGFSRIPPGNPQRRPTPSSRCQTPRSRPAMPRRRAPTPRRARRAGRGGSGGRQGDPDRGSRRSARQFPPVPTTGDGAADRNATAAARAAAASGAAPRRGRSPPAPVVSRLLPRVEDRSSRSACGCRPGSTTPCWASWPRSAR